MGFRRLYAGEIFEVWIVRQAGGSQVMDYYRGLDRRTSNRMFAIIRKTADEGKYTTEDVYRHVGDGVYEFKAWTARMFSFDDERRIVLTHGATKPKSIVKDRERAKRAREDYEAWKGQKK